MMTEPHRRPGPHYPVNGALVVILLVVVAALLYRQFGQPLVAYLHDPDAQPRTVTPRGDLAADEAATIELYERAGPSVVNVTTLAPSDEPRKSFYVQEGTGSGFVWDDQGYIVTNYHVIYRAKRARVRLSTDKVYNASLVGIAPDKDLAVLKIEAPAHELHPITIGESSTLKVGQKVFAIGNPFGLDQTLTTGVVSGLGREIESVTRRPIVGVIQTNAAINPGNSGGPLLDSAGRLIGINTAIYSPSGASAGVGFAIPVDTVNENVPVIIRDGKVDRPGLGILLAYEEPGDGVLIDEVFEGTAAAEAGLRACRRGDRGEIVDFGDKIIAIDDHQTPYPSDLFRALARYNVGDVVAIHVIRNGREITLSATLQPLPSMRE